MKLLKDADAPIAPIKNRTVAVIGYGNQGRAQACNLRDSGIRVVVGNRDDSYRQTAIDDGFDVRSIPDAAAAGDILLILTTDESQPLIWDDQIAPGLDPNNVLVWASGYNIAYDLIKPPASVDVVMVAPRMTGNMVRQLYQRGRGAVAQFAVHHDASGEARDVALAICHAIGATRVGAFESTFREEAELDLFAEQVVWAGLTAWFKTCFELGIEAGFSPELMVMELYASGEAAEIMQHMAQNGFFRQLQFHSTTSQYGTLSRGPSLIPDAMRQRAREIFQSGIRDGSFAREWSDEQSSGSQRLQDLTAEAMQHPMSITEEKVIAMMRSQLSDNQPHGT